VLLIVKGLALLNFFIGFIGYIVSKLQAAPLCIVKKAVKTITIITNFVTFLCLENRIR
jgi:hypothetical protein